MASALRRAVEDEAGELITTMRALRDGYGFMQLTAAARAHIADELARQGLETHPPVTAAALEDTVAVRIRAVPRFPARARLLREEVPVAEAPDLPDRRRWWALVRRARARRPGEAGGEAPVMPASGDTRGPY